VASAAAPRTHPTIASGFTGRVAPIDYKKIEPLIIKILAMDCWRIRSTQPRIFQKKGNFGSFLPGFAGRIVPIDCKNISDGLPTFAIYAAEDLKKKVIFEFFLSGFTRRIVPIGYENNSID
jgi:hypothetical protein